MVFQIVESWLATSARFEVVLGCFKWFDIVFCGDAKFCGCTKYELFICNPLIFQRLTPLTTNSLLKISHKIKKNALISKKCSTFAVPKGIPNARVAESVDALVSNTSSFTGVPVRPRPRVQKGDCRSSLLFCFSHIQTQKTSLI